MSNRTHKPIAVLLVHPNDLPPSLNRPTIQFYESLFLQDELSINNYWLTMSDGHIDLEGTQVFEWRSHGLTRQEFSKLKRSEKIRRAVEVFANNADPALRIDLTKFDSVAVFGDPSDEGGSSGILSFDFQGRAHNLGTAIFQIGANHRLICHEMGHGFGFDHSFDDNPLPHDPYNDNRPGAYGDDWDIMSAERVTSFNSKFGLAGPGLNTVMRDIANWLLPSRFIDGNNMKNEIVTIYENTNSDFNLPQVLKIEDYYFEFIMNSGWYAGFDTPSVQVRINDYNQGEHSKLIKVAERQYALIAGQTFLQEFKSSRFSRLLKVTLESVNVAEKSATLKVTHSIELVSYIDPEIHRRIIRSDIQILAKGNTYLLPPVKSFEYIIDAIGIVSIAYTMEDNEHRYAIYKTMSATIGRELKKLDGFFKKQ